MMRGFGRSIGFSLLLCLHMTEGAPAAGSVPLACGPVFEKHSGTAACMFSGSCTKTDSFDDPYGPGAADKPLEEFRICESLTAAAHANGLPVDFFAALIWHESHFDPQAVSRTGAQGVAQFMPATAVWRGVTDPFNPAEAINKSAQLLGDLVREFGNLGLAAAAYNAGQGRVRDWLNGRRGLPNETRAYVRVVTGQSPEYWSENRSGTSEKPSSPSAPCRQTGTTSTRFTSATDWASPKHIDPWGWSWLAACPQSRLSLRMVNCNKSTRPFLLDMSLELCCIAFRVIWDRHGCELMWKAGRLRANSVRHCVWQVLVAMSFGIEYERSLRAHVCSRFNQSRVPKNLRSL